MTYAYLLAGENLELAEHELHGFMESQEINPEIKRYGKLAVAPEVMTGQLKRLALTHEVSEIIERGDMEDLEIDYRPEGSFAVRAVEVSEKEYDTASLQSEVGAELSTESNDVNLERPGEELRLYLLEDEYILARLVEDINRGLFEKRKNQERPFSSPVSLDPVLARVLVNLSGVKPGGHLLDPFCGTGGILIEAGLCGVGVHGLDVQENMVNGAKENLETYGVIVHDVKNGRVKDAAMFFDQKFDVIVTDMPYGEASKVEDNPLEDFLEVTPELANRRIVFMSDQETIGDLEPEHEIYVHKNLTRYVYVVD